MPGFRSIRSRSVRTSVPRPTSQSTESIAPKLIKLIEEADLPRQGCCFAPGRLEELSRLLSYVAGEDRYRANIDIIISAWTDPRSRSALLQLWSVLLRTECEGSSADQRHEAQCLVGLTNMLTAAIFSKGRIQDQHAFVGHLLSGVLATQLLPAASALFVRSSSWASSSPARPLESQIQDFKSSALASVYGVLALASMAPQLQLPGVLGMAGPAVLAALADSCVLEHGCRSATDLKDQHMGDTVHSFRVLLHHLGLLLPGSLHDSASAVLDSGVLQRIGSRPCLQYYLALYTLSQLRGGPRPRGPLYGLQEDALLPTLAGRGCGGAEEQVPNAALMDDTYICDTLMLWTFFHSRLGVLKDGVVSLRGVRRLCLEVAEAGLEGLGASAGGGGRRSGGAAAGLEGGAAAGAAWWPSVPTALQAVDCAGMLLDPVPHGDSWCTEQEIDVCLGLFLAAPGTYVRDGLAHAAAAAAVEGHLFGVRRRSSSSSAGCSVARCGGGEGSVSTGGVPASTCRLRAWWRMAVRVAHACMDGRCLDSQALPDLLALRLCKEPATAGAAALPPAPPRNMSAALSAGYVPCLERLLRECQRARDAAPCATVMLGLLAKGGNLLHLMTYSNVRQVAALVATAGKLLTRHGLGFLQPGKTGGVLNVLLPVMKGDAVSTNHLACFLQFLGYLARIVAVAAEGTNCASTAGSGEAAGASSDGGGSSSGGSGSSSGRPAGPASNAQSAAAPAAAADSGARFRALASLALVRWLPLLAHVASTPAELHTDTNSRAFYGVISLVASCVVMDVLPVVVSAYQGSVARGDAAAAASWRDFLLHDVRLQSWLEEVVEQLGAAKAGCSILLPFALSRAAAALESFLPAFPEVVQGALAAETRLIGVLRSLFGPFGARPSAQLLLRLERLVAGGVSGDVQGHGGLGGEWTLASGEQASGDSSCGRVAAVALVPPCRLAEVLELPLCANLRCRNVEGPSEVDLKLSRCGRCQAVWYCCRECQEEHWRARHKLVCSGAGTSLV